MRKHDEPQPVRETLTLEERAVAMEKIADAIAAYKTGGREAMHRKLEELIGRPHRNSAPSEDPPKKPDP